MSKARFHCTLGAILCALLLLFSPKAFATCSSPLGNAGDIGYSSTQNIMVYCNGTSWVVMGSSTSTSFGSFITNDFCTATNSTTLACTTASTGTGNVVLSAAPTLTGTVTGANSTWTQIAVGTTTLSGAANINGTVRATTFSGSGSALTGIGTANLGSISGTPSSTTYLRGDGTWASVGASMVYPGAGIPNSTGSAWGTSYSVTGTGNVVLSASPTLTGTVTAANLTLSGTEALQFGSDYTTTGTQADVAISTTSSVRYNGSGTATFYGIVAGSAGQILNLHNASSSVLTVANQSSSEATAGNKIITGTGADLAMAANSSITLQYDNTAARWRVIGGSGGATAAGTTGQVQYNSGSSTLAANSNFTWLAANNQLVVGTGAATPAGTSGTVAGVIMNVIPQAGTFATATTTGGITLNPATTGQMAYYSGASAISGTPNLYVSGGNIGIGTSSATNLLSLDGQNPQIFWMEREYTTDTAGNNLTVQAGGATSAATNKNGGNLILSGGTSTGSGTSQIQFQTFPGTAGATSDNTAATAMTILGNGSVGIGTTSPGTLLDVNGYARFGGQTYGVGVANGDTTAAQVAELTFGTAHTAGYDWIQSFNSKPLSINPLGNNVGIGTTNPQANLQVNGYVVVGNGSQGGWLTVLNNGQNRNGVSVSGYGNSIGYGIYMRPANDSGPTPIGFFNASGTFVGAVQTSASATTYVTSSDRRLKENIVPTVRGLNLLVNIPVDDFNFISDPDKKRVQGFIAQDLYKIYPEAVTVGGDDPKKHPWAVDYGRLTPLAIKAIQEQQAEIETLKTDNDNQAARLETLEDEIAQIKAAAVTGKGAPR